MRRGNPSGESHLYHSRANKKSRQDDAARVESSTPTDVNPPHPLDLFSPTNLDATFDFNTLNLGRPQYVERPKKSKRSTGSHSNRASLGVVSTSGYDPANYGYVSGHVTPDSATTSGAATPYPYHHESRSNQISPTGAYNPMNGRDMGFGGVNRASRSSNYNNGTLPHIAQSRGGGHDIDWNSFPNFNSTEDYGITQYHSGTNTPLQIIKSEGELPNHPISD